VLVRSVTANTGKMTLWYEGGGRDIVNGWENILLGAHGTCVRREAGWISEAVIVEARVRLDAKCCGVRRKMALAR
jgi:hypothetical protein